MTAPSRSTVAVASGLAAAIRAAIAKPVSRTLTDYARHVQPGYATPPHIRALIARLERIESGDLKRLIVCCPPRHGKSVTCSTIFPAWYLGRHPDRGVIAASYGQALADDFGRRVRNLIASDEHRAVFPGSAIAPDSAAAQRFALVKGGTYFAVGRGAAVTGRGGDVLIVDDPLRDREEADSETVRRSMQDWYSQVAYTRLQPNGAVLVIETRWHMDDLAGWLVSEHAEEGWEVLSFPAIAEDADELGRKEGEALWPERFDLEKLRAIKAQLGGSAFAALYQQRPAAAEGAIFKRAWWGRYSELPATFSRVIQVWDTAFKSGDENDFSACTTWAETSSHYYLVHAWRGRVEFPGLIAKAKALAEAWKPTAVLIEDKASGQSLIQTLRVTSSLPVLPIKVGTDKVSRANAVTPLVEAGKALLPVAADWLDDYLEEISAFPTSKHDDWTDTTTMALGYLKGDNASPGSGWLELARRAAEARKARERAA